MVDPNLKELAFSYRSFFVETFFAHFTEINIVYLHRNFIFKKQTNYYYSGFTVRCMSVAFVLYNRCAEKRIQKMHKHVSM